MEFLKSLSLSSLTSLFTRKSVPGVASRTFSLGGHRSFTILIVAVVLFVSVAVYFVNAFVITSHDDPAYLSQAQQKSQLIHFNTSLLKQAQEFSAKANDTTLPSGRINPFGS